jgi:hypothetical protein
MSASSATRLYNERGVHSKAQVDNLQVGKANAGHMHGISSYTGIGGDPPHEHLVQGMTGIEQY